MNTDEHARKSLRSEIYDLRKGLEAERQPGCSEHIEQLESKIHPEHPYSLSADSYQRLKEVNEYSVAGRGGPAEVPKSEYIYRLTAAIKLYNFITGRWFPSQGPGKPSDNSVFNGLVIEYQKTKRWLRLANYASGELGGLRSITWWTGQEISGENALQDALSLGMAADWFPKYPVLLRCQAAAVFAERSVRIPNGLDAFHSTVFHPTREKPRPPSGVTIAISRTNKLSRGKSEYVARPVPVRHIELIPLLRDFSIERSRSPVEEDLLDPLTSYYKELIKGNA